MSFERKHDITPWNVRHAQAKDRFKSMGRIKRSIPRMGCSPVMTHDDSARDIEHIEQPDQIASGIQRRVRGWLCGLPSCGRSHAYLDYRAVPG